MGAAYPGKGRSIVVLCLALSLAGPLGGSARAALGVHTIAAEAEGACAACHNVGQGTAATRGWGRTLAGVPATGWYTQSISGLCWSCHSPSGTAGGNDVTGTALSAINHSYTISNAPPGPLTPTAHDNTGIVGSNLPYTIGAAAANLQCTSCHNVHNDQYRPYNMKSTIRGLCDTCHPRRNTSALRAANIGVGSDNVSLHPVNVAMASTTGASSIKTVAAMDAAMKVAYAAPYVLGGKLTGGATGNVTCETCHAVHGTNTLVGVNDLLAIDQQAGAATAPSSALCEGCHFGGAAGQQAGASGSDHPLDNGIGRAFYPAGVGLPAEWTQAGGRLDRGASVFTTAGGVTGTPRCSSCHDAHGGLGGKSLLRGPIPAAAGGSWCLACHTALQLAPQAHHSAKGLEGGQFASSIGCGECHGAGWAGHNGFFDSYVLPGSGFTSARGRAVTAADVAANKDSALCIYCHSDDDPLNWRADNTVMNPMPRVHGTKRGGGSHYLGPDTNLAISGISTPVNAILFAGSWAADNAAYSKYGEATGGGNVPPVVGSGSTVICESCHSIMYNEGAIHPAAYPNRTTAGWWTNLLLKPYEDDPPGTGTGTNEYAIGSELCTGCHAEAAPKHHPMTGDVLTSGSRTASILITGLSSYASKTTAPGTLSYPAADRMDCDSCHRAHSADSDSSVAGSARYGRSPVFLLLEVDSPGNDWASSLCAECHPQ